MNMSVFFTCKKTVQSHTQTHTHSHTHTHVDTRTHTRTQVVIQYMVRPRMHYMLHPNPKFTPYKVHPHPSPKCTMCFKWIRHTSCWRFCSRKTRSTDRPPSFSRNLNSSLSPCSLAGNFGTQSWGGHSVSVNISNGKGRRLACISYFPWLLHSFWKSVWIGI